MSLIILFVFFKFFIFIYGCVGSSFLCEGFLQLRQAGATPHRGAQASHYRGPSCCRAQAPDVQAQQLWLTGPVAPRHMGSSQTRARTRVPRISRQTLNHCATREAHTLCLKVYFVCYKYSYFSFLLVSFAWNVFFHFFTLSRCVSLKLKWFFCRQHIVESCFFIQLIFLCLLIGEFSTFTLKVIIDRYGLTIAILLIIFWLFCNSFVLFLLLLDNMV